jgi:hypothetical protein
MSNRLLVRASLVALLGMTLGCGKNSPTGPSQQTIPGAVIPPASITAVSPNTGSTGGSTPVTITGTGFQSGATVALDGTALERRDVYVRNSTTIHFSTPAHAAGTVDVVVTNPGGQADRLTGGYTYDSPQSFDFNGNWAGAAGSEYDTEMRFAIQDDMLISVSCGTSATLTFSPPPSVSNGEFSFVGNDGVGISGRIVSAVNAVGTINIAPCTSTIWGATRSQGAQGATLR